MKKYLIYGIIAAAIGGGLLFMKNSVDKFENNAKPSTYEVKVQGDESKDDMKDNMNDDMKDDMKSDEKDNMKEDMKDESKSDMESDMKEDMKDDMKDENMDKDDAAEENMDKDDSSKEEMKNENAEYNKHANFTLKNLNGEEVSLSDFQGKKIFLNFWATWCPNCRQEMPHIQELAQNFGDDVQVIAVNAGESEDTVRDYIEKNDFDFTVLLDQESDVVGKYGVTGFPTTILLDENGNPIYGQVGRMSYETMVDFIKGEVEE